VRDEEVLVDRHRRRRPQQVRPKERDTDDQGDAEGTNPDLDRDVAPGMGLAEELRRGPGRVRPAA
jgi:hypothetical protein